MLRLVSIADGVLDRDDLAMWLIHFPVTMGFGYFPRYMISSWSVSPIFEGVFSLAPIFIRELRQRPKFLHKFKVNENEYVVD